MRRHIAHEGEAAGLPSCAVASVELRLSAMDRMVLALRWMLTVAGAVVVLWIGSAFLATPASAVATPAAAVSAGVLKGGNSNSANGTKKNEKKSGGKSEKAEKKSGKKADKAEKKSGKKADKAEKKSGKKADKAEKSEKKAEKSGKKISKAAKSDKNGGVAEETDELLRQRIVLEKSREKLRSAKRERTAGEITKRQYSKQVASHRAVGQEFVAERRDVSPEQRRLVDKVVDGQDRLAAAEKRLAVEKRKVAAGTMSRTEYRQHEAAYEKLRRTVYSATDELMELTDRDAEVDPADHLDGRGAAGGCGTDGVFVECGSVSEAATGKRDVERCVAVSGLSAGCGVTTSAGGAQASASCDLTGSDRGCVSTVAGRGDDGTRIVAAARCEGQVRGCAQHSVATAAGGESACRSGGGTCTTRAAGPLRDAEPGEGLRTAASCTGVCTVDSVADRQRVGSSCATESGRCLSRGVGADEDSFGEGLAGAGERVGAARANCTAADGCGTTAELRHDGENGIEAVADFDCAGAACAGRAATRTDADHAPWVSKATRVRWAGGQTVGEAVSGTPRTAANAGARCVVSGGGCRAASLSDGQAHAGEAEVTLDCERADCRGTGVTRTAGSVQGMHADASRTARDRSSCETAGGSCEAYSGVEVDRTTQERRVGPVGDARTVWADRLSATVTSGAQFECERAACTGSAQSGTSGRATGDVRGVRSSAGEPSCRGAGAGAECETEATTTVADRDRAEARAAGLAVVSGPVSVSESGVSVDCDGGDGSCHVSGIAGSSARDTGVTPHGRGSSADLECKVSGGDCGGRATSASSSAADHVVLDPRTGKPLAGQPRTGPSSTSSSEAYLECAAGSRCSGSVRTGSSAWDGAVDGGEPRASRGDPTSCTGVSGGCEARSVSTASSGPGASLALAADPNTVNTKRLPAGPSAASASGAVLYCDGGPTCTGTVRSAASAIDPARSAEPSGSWSAGTCSEVRGGVCVAVTNSGSSTGPDANVIAPLMQQRSTANATITEDTTGDPGSQQPPTVPAPAVPAPAAPGSSANAGGPTVPGASSWSMADADLDCSGSTRCSGTTRTVSDATDGPVAGNGAGGARGPPMRTSDTASCATGESACVARSGSVAGSGQVVADMIAEQQDETAGQLAEQATRAQQAAREAAQVAAEPGATAKQKKTAQQAKAAARELRKAAREAAAEAAKPVRLADVVGQQLDAAAEQAALQAKQARTDAAKATRIAARKGATAKQEKAAKAAWAAARSARVAAREAARVAELPVRGATAAMSESTATAQCAGPGCDARTTAGTSGKVGSTPTAVRCRAAASGCAVGSDSSAMFTRYTSGGTRRALGSGQTGSQVDCPDAGCRGWVSGTPKVQVGPDGRHNRSTARGIIRCAGTAGCQAALTAATSVQSAGDDRAGSVRTGSATVGIECPEGRCDGWVKGGSSAVGGPDGRRSRSVARGVARCAGTAECRAEITAASSLALPGTAGRLRGAEGSATVGIDCPAGSCTGRVTGASSAVGGPDGRHSRSVARGGARCTGAAACRAGVTVSSSVQAGPAASGARFATTNAAADASCGDGTARGCRTYSYSRTLVRGAVDGSVRNKAGAVCRAAGRCGAATSGSATAGVAQTTADCVGKGCRTYNKGRASAATTGGRQVAAAWAACAAGKSGRCASYAQVAATDEGMQAAAGCEGARCRYDAVAAGKAGVLDANGAEARSACGDRSGRGRCAATAAAQTRGGESMAAASCQGTKGSGCRYDYAASSEAGAAGAAANVSCSKGGGRGSGWCATNAVAESGAGQSMAAASCSGSRGTQCTYDATSHSAAAGAYADAQGHGATRTGMGFVQVSTSAQNAGGVPQASASCTGSAGADCSHHWSVTASDYASHPSGSWASAYAHDEGGGAMGSSGGWVFANAEAGDRWANAEVACSNPAHCSKTARAHVEFTATWETAQTWIDAHRKWRQYKEGTCTSGTACGLFQNGTEVGCTGDCSGLSVYAAAATFVNIGISAKAQQAAAEQAAANKAAGGSGAETSVGAMGREYSAAESGDYDQYEKRFLDPDEKRKPSAAAPIRPFKTSDHMANEVPYTPATRYTPAVRVKESGSPSVMKTCRDACRVGGKGGPRASYDPDAATPYKTSNPVAPGAAKRDRAVGEGYAYVGRDSAGNGLATIKGRGFVHDGRTDQTMRAKVVNADTTNTARLTDPHGSPFLAADANGRPTPLRTGLPNGEGWIKIIGKEIQIPGRPKGTLGRDVFDIRAPEIDFRGRDGNGNPGTIGWDGTGRGRLAEGYVITGQGPAPGASLFGQRTGSLDLAGPRLRQNCLGPGCNNEMDGVIPSRSDAVDPSGAAEGKVTVVTPGGNGLGGRITIDGSAEVTGPGGVTLDCDNCIGTHHMPTTRGEGGINTCAIRPGGSCSGEDAWTNGRSDVQEITAVPNVLDDNPSDDPPVAAFVQQLRGVDGSGGGAVVFLDGAAEARGTDAYGNWVSTWGKGGRTTLLYGEKDGFNTGQSRVAGARGGADGSARTDRLLEWVEPTADVTAAVGLTAPSMGTVAGPFATGVEGPIGSQTLLDRGKTVVLHTRDRARLRWNREIGQHQLASVLDEIGIGKKWQGKSLTPAEQAEVADAIVAADPVLAERLAGLDDAIATVLAIEAVHGPTVEAAEAALGGDRELSADIGCAAAALCRAGVITPPTDHVTDPKHVLIDAQQEPQRLARTIDDEFTSRSVDLHDRNRSYAQDSKAYETDRKRLVRDIDAFETDGIGNAVILNARIDALNERSTDLVDEGAEIDAASDALVADSRPYFARLDESQDVLRSIDLVVVEASGDRELLADIRVARANVDAVRGLVDALPKVRTVGGKPSKKDVAAQRTIRDFVEVVQSGYAAAVEAPRSMSHPLGDMRLPSTGAADLALAMRASRSFDYFTQVAEGNPTGPLGGKTDDEIANHAAWWTRGDPTGMDALDIAGEPAMPAATAEEVTQAQIGWDDGSPEYRLRHANLFRQISHERDWLTETVGAHLPAAERAKLTAEVDTNQPWNVKNAAQYLIDGTDYMVADAVQDFDRKFGAGYDDETRNGFRNAAAIGVGTLGIVHRAVGQIGVESSNRNEAAREKLRDGTFEVADALQFTGVGIVHSMFDPDAYFTQEKAPNETDTEYYQRVAPLTGSWARTPTANAIDRHFVSHTAAEDYQRDPLFTLMEDALPLTFITGPAGGALRGGARAAVAGRSAAALDLATVTKQPRTAVTQARAASLRADMARLQERANALDLGANILSVPSQVLAAPFTAAGIPARVGALGVRAVAAPAALRMQGKSTAARASGKAADADRYASRADGLAALAESARMTARYGPIGRFGEQAAYSELGVSRVAPTETVLAGYRARSGSIGTSNPVAAARQASLLQSLTTVGVRRAHAEGFSLRVVQDKDGGWTVRRLDGAVADTSAGPRTAQSIGDEIANAVNVWDEAATNAQGAAPRFVQNDAGGWQVAREKTTARSEAEIGLIPSEIGVPVKKGEAPSRSSDPTNLAGLHDDGRSAVGSGGAQALRDVLPPASKAPSGWSKHLVEARASMKEGFSKFVAGIAVVAHLLFPQVDIPAGLPATKPAVVSFEAGAASRSIGDGMPGPARSTAEGRSLDASVETRGALTRAEAPTPPRQPVVTQAPAPAGALGIPVRAPIAGVAGMVAGVVRTVADVAGAVTEFAGYAARAPWAAPGSLPAQQPVWRPRLGEDDGPLGWHIRIAGLTIGFNGFHTTRVKKGSIRVEHRDGRDVITGEPKRVLPDVWVAYQRPRDMITSHAEGRRPGPIGDEWERYTPAERAEAWREEQRTHAAAAAELEPRIAAAERDGAAAELAELEHHRAELQKQARLAQGYVEMHREIAERTNRGRTELAATERRREQAAEQGLIDIRRSVRNATSAAATAFHELLYAANGGSAGELDEAKANHDAALRNRDAVMRSAHEQGFTPEEIATFAGDGSSVEDIVRILDGNGGSDRSGPPVIATSGVPPSGNGGGGGPASDASSAGAGTPQAADAAVTADSSAQRTVPNTEKQSRGPPTSAMTQSDHTKGAAGPSRRGGGDFTGRMAAKLAAWLATQFRRGTTVVVHVAVRDEHGAVVGVLTLYPVRGLSAWVSRKLGVDDLVAFAWVGSGERLVAVDAELFAQIQRVNEVIEAARDRSDRTRAAQLQRLLDGWVLDLFRHENVHFDHPDARHDDHVFDAHRDVRHHLLDRAVAFAEYVDRTVTFSPSTRRTREAKRLLTELNRIHQELRSAQAADPAPLLAEAARVLAELDEKLGRAPPVQPAPVRGRAAARRQALQIATEGWARQPAAGLGAGDAAMWAVWRLLGALWWGDGSTGTSLALAHPRGLTAAELVARIGDLAQQLADGQPIAAPAWAAEVIRQMAARGLHESAATGTVAGWLAELERNGLLVKNVDLFRTERFKPGGVFGDMLARAPPQVVEALWRNPLGVVGVGVGRAGLSTGAQAAAVQAWVRGVVLAWGQVERGFGQAVPLRLRAWRFAGELRWTVQAARLALIDLVNASNELAGAVTAGVTGAELEAMVEARDEASGKFARIVRDGRDVAVAHGVGARRALAVGWQPRLLVEYQRRIYLSAVQSLFVLGAGLVDPSFAVLAAVLSLVMFWPHWRPRPAGSYERMSLGKRISSFAKRVRDTPWERGGAIGYSFPLWTLAMPLPLVGFAVLAAQHPAVAWLVPLLAVLSLQLSISVETLVARIPDPMMPRLLGSLPAQERNWWLGGTQVQRVSVSLVVFGFVKISVFVQQFTPLVTGFGQVPGVLPPTIVGFHPWLRLKARWASYDKGVWSKQAGMFVFWQAGFGFGLVGGVLVEPRRSLRKLILRTGGRQRVTVDTFDGPSRFVGKAVFMVLRTIAQILPTPVRDRFVGVAAWRAEQADRQQARHARTMLGQIEAALALQQARLAEIDARLADAKGKQRARLEGTATKLEKAISENQERAATIQVLRFDRYRVARARRMMTHVVAVLERLERRLREVEVELAVPGLSAEQHDRLQERRADLQTRIGTQQDRRKEIDELQRKIAAAAAGLPAATPSWSARLNLAIRNWLGRSATWLISKTGAATQRLARAWAQPRVRWTVLVLVGSAVVAMVLLFLAVPATAAGISGSAAAGAGAGPVVAVGVAVAAVAAAGVAGMAVVLARFGLRTLRGWLGRVSAHGPPALVLHGARWVAGGAAHLVSGGRKLGSLLSEAVHHQAVQDLRAAGGALLAAFAVRGGAAMVGAGRAIARVAEGWVRWHGSLDTARGPPGRLRRIVLVAVPIALSALLSAAAPAVGAERSTVEVVVVENDTLTGIAVEHGTTVEAIDAANPGRFPTDRSRDLIFPGEHLAVPGAPAPPTREPTQETQQPGSQTPNPQAQPSTSAPSAQPSTSAPSVQPSKPGPSAQPSTPAPSAQPGTPAPSVQPADGAGFDWAYWWRWIAGGVAAAGGYALLRRWTGVKRARAWAERRREWAEIAESGADAASPLSALVVWLVGTFAADPGAAVPRTVRAATAGAPSAEASLAALSAYLAALPKHTIGRLVAQLVAAGLVRVERAATGPVLVASVTLVGLLARAPPELIAALVADPATVLRDDELAERSAPELVAAVLAVLRDGVWDAQTARPGGWEWIPLRLRGRAGELARLFASVKAVADDINSAAADLRKLRLQRTAARELGTAVRLRQQAELASAAAWMVPVGPARLVALVAASIASQRAERGHRRVLRRLPADLRGASPARAVATLEARVRAAVTGIADLQEAERTVAVEASNAAAAAGFSRQQTGRRRDRAILGWARFMPALAGLMGAFPGQAAGAQMIAGKQFAETFGEPTSWVTQQGAIGTSVAAGAGLAAALLGDRLIKNMVVIVALGVAGSGALLVMGVFPVAALFLPAVLTVGVMGVAGGLARGRMDRYHPVAAELKNSRDTSYETAFKAAQFLFPLAISQGTAIVGVPLTMVVLSVVAIALTVAVWLVMRGESTDARPRAPPTVLSSVKGNLAQAFSTPRGLARWVLSIPLFTLLTGLYATALGGVMIDQLVFVNDPVLADLQVAAVVSVLVSVRGLFTLIVGARWAPFKELLGRPGAIGALFGRKAPVGELSESRVLMAVTLLAGLLVVPAAWLLIAPGNLAFGLLLTLTAVLTAWARMPTNRWTEGATGASLNNTAKAGSIALGALVAGGLLGGYTDLVDARVTAGLDPADLIAAANTSLALLTVPIVVLPIVAAYLIGKLRIGTIDELRTALEHVAATDEQIAEITGKLTSHGLNDIGSVRALFAPGTWAPRVFTSWRATLREQRIAAIELTDTETATLVRALDHLDS